MTASALTSAGAASTGADTIGSTASRGTEEISAGETVAASAPEVRGPQADATARSNTHEIFDDIIGLPTLAPHRACLCAARSTIGARPQVRSGDHLVRSYGPENRQDFPDHEIAPGRTASPIVAGFTGSDLRRWEGLASLRQL